MASNDLKSRITSHMNKEHAADLKRYLRAFNGLSSSAAANAQLVDVSLETMTIQSASGLHTIRISPPMKSFADARVRLANMAGEALSILGLSDIQINRFQGPTGGGYLFFAFLFLLYISTVVVALDLITPGTQAWPLLDKYSPYGAANFVRGIKIFGYPYIVIHTFEAVYMARSRLAKYGIETGSVLWFRWIVQTLIEGFPNFLRFDALVKEERKKKDATKH
ncbi:hypothetical protein GGS21DRAFT_541840 [Xylaria nigripes]|nr:hypothetical protein GGS21DRAFT_541840 [Xylaria nigripes]